MLPVPPQEVCPDCLLRDQDVEDVDVLSPGVWWRESDVAHANSLSPEDALQAAVLPLSEDQRLTERKVEIWLLYDPFDQTRREPMIDAWVKSQRELLEPEQLEQSQAAGEECMGNEGVTDVQLQNPSPAVFLPEPPRGAEQDHDEGAEFSDVKSRGTCFTLDIGSIINQRLLPEDMGSQNALNMLQTWLDNHRDHEHRQRAIAFIIRLVSECGDDLPDALLISGVSNIGSHPVAGGRFADVYRGTYLEQTVAIKQLREFLSPEEMSKVRKRFVREAITWRQFDHPRLLTFMGVDREAWNRAKLSMISPWIMRGTLMKYLKQANVPIECQTLIADVASGLSYLHAQNFAHGDLHGENVLIDEQDRAVLGDFGLTAVTDMSELVATTTINKAGAIRWLSPELLDDEHESPPRKTMSGDIFAFGRICLSVYTRNVPFHNIKSDSKVMFKVMSHQHPSKPTESECPGEVLPENLWQLILKCWNADVEGRPGIKVIVRQLQDFSS